MNIDACWEHRIPLDNWAYFFKLDILQLAIGYKYDMRVPHAYQSDALE